MKVLVLGGNGFIGSHVVDRLLAAGHEVRVFARRPDPWRAPLQSVRYYLGDFANTLLLSEAIQGVDAVVHSLSETVPSTSNLDPIADIQKNLEQTVRLLQIMVSCSVQRIVFLSSGGTVYGQPMRLPVSEDHPLNPICSYGVVKVAIEKYLGMFRELSGLRPLIIRPANVYGPRHGHSGVQGSVGTFMQKVVSGETFSIWGDGSVIRDYLYVTDLAELVRLATESDHCDVVNAGAGVGYSLNQLLEMIEVVAGRKAVVQYHSARRFDVREIVLDIQGAQRTFLWQPSLSLQQGLKLYDNWNMTPRQG